MFVVFRLNAMSKRKQCKLSPNFLIFKETAAIKESLGQMRFFLYFCPFDLECKSVRENKLKGRCGIWTKR